MDMPRLLAQLHAAADAATPAPETLAAWRAGHRVQASTFASAVAAGATAGQLAFAFAGGYQAALRQFLPDLAADVFAALLLSEGKRQRPDELLTTLTPLGDGSFRLDGEKSYVMGGADADLLLVVARQGVDADGRITSGMVILPAHAAGITHSARTDAIILPALPHGRARFENVRVDAAMVLPGDGWVDYARPFRTLEDIHVSAAVAAHLAVHAIRRHFPQPLLASLLTCLLRLDACARAGFNDPQAHVLLAGAERELQQAGAQTNDLIKGHDDGFARDWRANHLVVAMAAPARAKRLEKALATLQARSNQYPGGNVP
jgi:acyl-CoA dehydrogenase